MKTSNTQQKSRVGFRQSLGRVIAFVLRKECQFLIRKGLSTSFAKKLAIVINLFILISLLFILFPMWMGLVTLIIGALLLAGVDIDIKPPKTPELRNGWDGFGYYNEHDFRLDGSADDEE